MAYVTKLESWKKVELQNAGITIHVHQNGAKLGRLEVSKGRERRQATLFGVGGENFQDWAQTPFPKSNTAAELPPPCGSA